MRPMFLLLLFAALPARAQDGASLFAAIRATNWPQAEALAARMPDPLAQKFVRYYRLLTPGAARSTEIAAFLLDGPDWPAQALLTRRLQEALALDGDDRAVLAICQSSPPQAAPSLLRCADATARAGRPQDAATQARAAWVRGLEGGDEIGFVRQWGSVLTADDQWRRFDRLAWSDNGQVGGPAQRQSIRIDPAQRPAAEARLALRRDAAEAPALVAALPLPAREDPGTVLDLAKWYRRAGLDRMAAQVWGTHGAAAESVAPPDRKQAFWDERNLLARRLLRMGEPAAAFAVADTKAQANEAALDSLFLSGWIALRRLNQPVVAEARFRALAGLSKSVITQSRAAYWLGRAAMARGDRAAATRAYEAAVQFPTTYYGQLAGRALGLDDAALRSRILALADPPWSAPAAQTFLRHEMSRAAVLLTAWGERRRAPAFLLRLDDLAPGTAERMMVARLASELGLPDTAVALARRAGRDGVMMPVAGWPMPVQPPGTVEGAVALGLMRQESSFDDLAVSPSGARGLMQLMPATAAQVARQVNEATSIPLLTEDPAHNMRLGTTYLRGLMDQFGALPMALAGYNAGPRRVTEWIVSEGDPRAGPIDWVDWIESIPFNETRNYVQRVMENIEIYRARQP